MGKTGQIIWNTIGIAVAIGLLGGAVAWGYTMRPSAAVCPSLTYQFQDADKRQYVTENELDSLLRREEVYPVGKHIDRLSIHRIEAAMQRHPMIERAECYTTPLYEVRVEILQRTPLLEVRTPIERYYIDTRHTVMPWREAIKDDVLVVTGAVGPQAAAGQLAEMAEWLLKEEYWRKRIHHVHMRTPANAVLYMEGEDMPQVVIGGLSDYPAKLRKLRTFLENSAEATQDKHYRELDVRFRGQVIGRN